MIMAVVGDINGNLTALRATLEAINARSIQTILHTGNAVVGGSHCNEIIDLLNTHRVCCVQGSRDRQLVSFMRKRAQLEQRISSAEMDALATAFDNLDSHSLEELRALKRTRLIEIDGILMFLCHGLPSSRSQVFDANTPLLRLRRERELAEADMIICGGANEFFTRTVEGARFICPGNIEKDSEVAQYTLVDTEESPWTIQAVTVPVESPSP